MNPTLRNVLSVVAGLLAGGVVIMAVEMIGMGIYPPPPDLTPRESTGRAANS